MRVTNKLLHKKKGAGVIFETVMLFVVERRGEKKKLLPQNVILSRRLLSAGRFLEAGRLDIVFGLTDKPAGEHVLMIQPYL